MADKLRPPGYRKFSFQRFLQPISERFQQSHIAQKVKEKIYGSPNFAILAGDAGMNLAQQVTEAFGKEVPDNPPPFANNELRVVVPDIVEQCDTYIIQAMNAHPNRSLRQLKLLGIGAKGRDANRVHYIFTGIPYTRQDREDQRGAPRAAQNVDLEIFYSASHNPHKRRHESHLTAPASLIIVDVHSEKPLEIITKDSRGTFEYRDGRYQWANLDSAYVLAPKIQNLITSSDLNPVIVFPDKGAAKRYENYAEMFGGGIENAATIDKVRPTEKNNEVHLAPNQDDVAKKVPDKDVFLIDDMIDTGGTTLQAVKLAKENGARSVWVIATHGIFSNDALKKMADPAIDGVIITDTFVPTNAVLEHPKIQIISITPLLVEVIRRIEAKESIADLVKSMSPGFEHSYLRLTKINKYRRRAKRQGELNSTKLVASA